MTIQTSMSARIREVAAAALLVFGSGCATVFNGSIQMVGVESTPPGAVVWLDGQRMEQPTPMSIPIERGYSNHVVRIEKEGYVPVETVLTSHFSLWLGADVAVCFTGVGLVPGILGLVVDLGSGTGAYYSPDPVEIRLNASGPMPSSPSKRGTSGKNPASISKKPSSSDSGSAASTAPPEPPASGLGKESGDGPPISPPAPAEVPRGDADELPPEIQKQYKGLLKMRDNGVISQDEFEDLERILLEGR